VRYAAGQVGVAHHHPDLSTYGPEGGTPVNGCVGSAAARKWSPIPTRPTITTRSSRRLRAPGRARFEWPRPDPVVVNFRGSGDGQRRGLLRLPRVSCGPPSLIRYDPDAPWPIWPDVTRIAPGARPHGGALAGRHAPDGGSPWPDQPTGTGARSLIQRLPKLSIIQAEGANALVRTLREAAASGLSPCRPKRVATAIRIGNPASWEKQ